LTEKDKEGAKQKSTDEILEEKTGNFRLPYCIYVAAKLGIADLLKDGPKGFEEIARAVEANPRGVLRLLQRLSKEGIFCELEHGHFGLTPTASLLQTGGWRERVIVWFEDWVPVEQQLLYTVKTGKSAFNQVHGMGLYEYAAENPTFDADFEASMSEGTKRVAKALIDSYGFSGSNKVVDVGGGHGVLISSVLKANPKLEGILFDRPLVVQGAIRILAAEGVEHRCELVGGDFFKSVPKGGDIYLLKSVLDDWEDDAAIQILTNIRAAMNHRRGKLLLIERLMNENNQSSEAKSADLNLMLVGRGRVRKETEISGLLAKAGFKQNHILATQSSWSIIEANPV